MAIEYGAKVIDANGEVLGTVDHLIHNTLTGEIKKFVVRRKAPEPDLFVSSQSVRNSSESEIELDVSLGELLAES